MKITRMKSGYTIRCNDSDFAAIAALLAGGTLAGDSKKAYTRRTKGGEFLRVDRDKRIDNSV